MHEPTSVRRDATLWRSISTGPQARVIANTFLGSGEVRVRGGASPLIEDNSLSSGSHLFLEAPGDDTVVRGITFRDLENAAIVLWSTGRPTIEDNTISNVRWSGHHRRAPARTRHRADDPRQHDRAAIEVAAGSLPTIESNSLAFNTSGIVIIGSDAVVTDNQIADNSSGVFVMQGSPSLEANTITGGKVGLGLGSDDATPVLVGNTICENETNLNLTFGAEMPDTLGNEICADEA